MPPRKFPLPLRAARRRSGLVAGIGLALLLDLTGCNGESQADVADPPRQDVTSGSQSPPPQAPPRSPLTGLPMQGGRPGHGIYVVKVDNTALAEPQVGLSSADLITEEMVEGGFTRLAVFYYSQIPKVVGPIRSMRASDIGIVKPAHAVLVGSGAARPTEARLDGAHVPQATQAEDPGYFRADDRNPAPYDLMLRLPTLVKAVKSEQPPGPYLPFGSEENFPAGKNVRSVEASFSASHTTTWRYKPGAGWWRTNSLAATGDDFFADNVVILRVRVVDAGYVDAGGYRVPETVLSGKGEALIIHEDQAVKASWSKESLKAPLRLTTKQGPLRVPAGHTFIELIPAEGGEVTLGR